MLESNSGTYFSSLLVHLSQFKDTEQKHMTSEFSYGYLISFKHYKSFVWSDETRTELFNPKIKGPTRLAQRSC